MKTHPEAVVADKEFHWEWRIPDLLWSQIEPLLPRHKASHPLGCHRKRVDNRAAMNAIFFVLRTGCQWNALNATGICSSSSAHRRFLEWVEAGVFERLWIQGLLAYDELQGIDWSWLCMDGAMTRAPLGGKKVGPNPTDRAQGGVKRRLLTEAAGIPIGLAIEGANTVDFKRVRQTLQSIPITRPEPTPQAPQGMCLDKGDDFDEVRALLQALGFTAPIRARGEEARAIKQEAGFRARRWVVERTHSGMNRFRRLLVRWEKKAQTYLAMLHFACALITYKRSGLLG